MTDAVIGDSAINVASAILLLLKAASNSPECKYLHSEPIVITYSYCTTGPNGACRIEL